MKIIIWKQNVVTIYVTLVILVLALPNTFFDGSPVELLFQYFDEIFTVFAFMQIFVNINKLKLDVSAFRLAKITFFLLFIILVLGFLSNYVSNLVNLNPILIDLLGIIKAPIVFTYCISLISPQDKTSILHNLKLISMVFVLSAFICAIVNFVFDIGMSFDVRYGLRSFTFLYSNPGGLNIALLSAYTVLYVTVKNKFTRTLFEFLALFTILMTFRGIGVGTVGIIIMLKIYAKKIGFEKPLSVGMMIPMAFGGFLLGYNQVKEYFIGSSSIRSILLKNAVVIMKRYFPLGSGFATYGSDQAFKHYSKLYYEFGYHYIYFLSPDNGAVANDNFWPMVMAQFGFFGLLLYLFLVYKQLQFVLHLKIKDRNKIVSIALLIFLFITSLGNAVYTSASGMLAYIMASLVINNLEI